MAISQAPLKLPVVVWADATQMHPIGGIQGLIV